MNVSKDATLHRKRCPWMSIFRIFNAIASTHSGNYNPMQQQQQDFKGNGVFKRFVEDAPEISSECIKLTN